MSGATGLSPIEAIYATAKQPVRIRICSYRSLRYWFLFICIVAFGLSRNAFPQPLRSLRAIDESTAAHDGDHLPVQFEATVTYYRGYEWTLFVQDGSKAIYVAAHPDLNIRAGDRVMISGITQGSFKPIVIPSKIDLIRHGVLPPPKITTFDEMIRGAVDSQFVSVRGQIQAVNYSYSSARRSIKLQMATAGGDVDVLIDDDKLDRFKPLLDSEVEIQGTAGGRFDGKQNQVGVVLHVPNLDCIKVLRRAGSDPWSLPITQMSDILTNYHVTDGSRRVHVQGTITYQQIGSAIVIQNKDRSLWVKTEDNNIARLGDLADVTGFPTVEDGFLALEHGDILDRYYPMPVQPQAVNWQEIAGSQHAFDLVSLEGTVVAEVREATQDNFILSVEGHMMSALVRRRSIDNKQLAALKQIPTGSRVRVTGVCVPGDSNPYNPNVPFNILMSSPDNIEILALPSRWNEQNLMRLVTVLVAVIMIVAGWGWTLRRRVRRQTAALAVRIEAEAALQRRLAHLEQRRRRIIEEINGDVPLAEILEQIAATTSLHLENAPCWFEAANGKRYGDLPLKLEGEHLLRTPIATPSGALLGTIFAAIPPDAVPPGADEALIEGARIATLAIETRRLYADLRHRSDFDQLTDLYNRSYLEHQLDELIQEARQTGALLALIYIDLDKFKQINDRHGHHIGDLYLKEVARRMKKQMRGADLLARLGGDEFVALLPQIHDRAEVEEIARRLERCFDDPFALENFLIKGNASFGISVYPQDATTKHELLRNADAVMYKSKRSKPSQDVAIIGEW